MDGDGDGTVTSDIGAFEYQAEPPSGAISAPGSAAIGQTIAFSHSMTDPDPTDTVAGVVWNFGDGSISTESAPSHAYAAAGNYTVTLSATNEAGFVGTATASIVVPATAATPQAVLPTAKIGSKPKKSVKTGKAGLALTRKGAPTFTVKYTGAAKAKFRLQTISRGRKPRSVKGSVVLPLASHSAEVKYSFGGIWKRKKLAPGNYRLTITPIATTGTPGSPVTVDLKLKK